MRSHEGRGRSGSPRRARHATRRFLPGWGESALEHRLLLSADVLPAAAASLTLAPTNLPNDTINTPYNQTITASGGTGGYSYAVTSGTLPAGLAINATSGAITGSPTATGSSTFTVTATDSSKDTGSQSYTVVVNSALSITTATLPSAVVSTAYTATLATTGGTGTPTFAVTTGTLPTGLALSTAGVLSGTPSTNGPDTFTITATDTAGATAAQSYSFFVNQFSLSPPTLPNDTVNVPYDQTVAASGGTSPYTYSVSTGNLPAGLSLNPTSGAITGTPTTAATADFTVTATDSASETASQAYAVTINPAVSITTTTLPNGITNTAYSQTVVATGGTGTLSYATTSGTLPAGLTLNTSSGLIAGTPTTAGTSPFSITVSDSVGGTATQSYSVTISTPIAFTTTSVPNTTVNVPYSQTLSATGGTGTLTYVVKIGSLPAGLSLSSAGVISGTPTTPGTSSFTVTASDSSGDMGSEGFAITVNPTLSFTTTSLPNGAAGTPYSQQVTATGGTAPLTYTLSTGSLPGGLSFASTGLISGTPTTPGTTNFTVKVTDAAGLTESEPLSLTILPAGSATGPTVTSVVRDGVHHQNTMFTITFSTPLDTTSAENLSNYTIVPIFHTRLDGNAVVLTSAVYDASNNTVTLTALGNVALNQEYVLSINGTTPTGVKDSSGNLLAGLNGAAGTNYVQYFGPEILKGRTAQAAYQSKLVTSLTTAINESSLTNGDIIALVTGNGAPGILAGTDVPLAVRIRKLAHNPSPVVGAAISTVVRNILNPSTPVLAIAPTTLPADTVGVAYDQTITASSGVAPYTYAVSSGALPAGLTLDASAGTITGTPTTAGTSAFTVTASDSTGVTGSQPYSVVINAAPTFTTTTLPAAAVGSPFSRQLAVSGGTGTIAFAVTTGSLPAGFNLSTTGLLAGTPTATGTTSFTVTATDSLGATATETYSLVVDPAVAITPGSLPDDTLNNPYSETVTATGGAGGFTYAISAGTLPTGLALGSTTGTISGTPTATGTSHFTVTATDTTGNAASQAYTVTINPGITFTTTTLPGGTIGTAYSQNVTATGGTGALIYTLTTGNLPGGLSLSNAGAITGTPSASGTSTFTVTATDTVGATKAQGLSITIA